MESTPIKFDIYEGDTLVRSEVLAEQTIKIGKLSSSHVRLDHDSVSRMHAVVEVGGPNEVVILDLGSATGTFVNGERVTKRKLRTGDQLTLGDLRVVITIAGQAPAESPAAAQASAPAQNVPLYDEEEEVAGASRALEVLAMVGSTVLSVRHSSQRTLNRSQAAGEASSSAATGGFLLGVMAVFWIGLGQAEIPEDQIGAAYFGIGVLGLAAVWYFVRAFILAMVKSWVDGPGDYGRDGVYTVGHSISELGGGAKFACKVFNIPTAGAWGPDAFLPDSAKLPSEPFALAETDGSSITVNVPDGVEGDILLDGEIHRLEDLRAQGKLSKGSGFGALRVPPRARCRLSFGDETFLVNSVVEAEPVREKPPVDWQGVRYKTASAVLHILFAVIVFSLPEDADSLALDAFSMDDRFVDFMLKPEEDKPKDLDDLFKDLDEGKSSEKAKGDEGKMGKKDEKDTKKRFAIEGPQDNTQIQLAKERARQEALQVANAAFQLEGELSAVWGEGDRAIGNDAVSALGNMFGDQVGDAQGFGGLGGVGVGRGGGGFGEHSIGVGNVGTMGRGGGGGGSGYGRGKSRLGERRAKVPKVIPGKPIIQGSLDMETIRRVIRRHANEYRYCYEKQLNVKRDLQGKIKVKFTIAGNGSVIAATISESSMKDRDVESCLVSKVKRWVFPAPKGGGIVIVNYPFIFKAS